MLFYCCLLGGPQGSGPWLRTAVRSQSGLRRPAFFAERCPSSSSLARERLPDSPVTTPTPPHPFLKLLCTPRSRSPWGRRGEGSQVQACFLSTDGEWQTVVQVWRRRDSAGFEKNGREAPGTCEGGAFDRGARMCVCVCVSVGRKGGGWMCMNGYMLVCVSVFVDLCCCLRIYPRE